MNKNILILSLSQIHKDPRVLRQIEFLKNNYRLTVAGYTNPVMDGVDFVKINPFLPAPLLKKLGKAWNMAFCRADSLFWNEPNIRHLADELLDTRIQFSLIIANDTNILPLAVLLAEKWSVPLLLDMHEYSPREFEESLIWRLKFGRYNYAIAQKYLKKCDAIITVCDSIKEEVKKEFGVTAEVLTNAPVFEELSPSPVDPNRISIIHHGGATRSRKIENMIMMMRFLDERYHLYFMLVEADKDYINELMELARGNQRIHFLDPVPTTQISGFINQFDIGLYLLEPTNYNNRIALPNKFFEFIQARLCVAIGPSPEMMKLTNQYNLGVTAKDFEPGSLAAEVAALTPEKIEYFKQQVNKAALELSAERNKTKILQIIQSLI